MVLLYSRSLPPFRNANPRASAPSAPLTRFPRPLPPPVRPNDPPSLRKLRPPKPRASDPNRAVEAVTAAISREAGQRHPLRQNARNNRDFDHATGRGDGLFETSAHHVRTGQGVPPPFMVLGAVEGRQGRFRSRADLSREVLDDDRLAVGSRRLG